MNILKNLSIRTKLILISLVPLLGTVYFLQDSVLSQLDRREAAMQVYRESLEVERISNLLHELQKERALTISYLATQKPDDRSKMMDQREATNYAASELKKIYGEHEKKTAIVSGIDTLTLLRNDINLFPDAINQIKLSLLNEIGNTTRISQNAEIKNLLGSHQFLLYAKEYLAQIRSYLSLLILSARFSENEISQFGFQKGQLEFNLTRFEESALPELKKLYERNTSGDAAQQMFADMDSVFKNFGFLASVSYDQWWINSTATINAFKEMEDSSLNVVKERAELLVDNITDAIITNLLITLFVIVIIIGLVVFTVKDIINSISNIKVAAQRMMNGEVGFAADVKSKDEIGDLAATFNKMIAITKEYAVFADTIAKGDYNLSVNIRSESDILGKALSNMKDNLLELSEENRVRTWLLAGNSELNDKMRGEKEIVPLAQDIISQLASYLNAQIGAIYIKENGHLNLAGSYAFHHRKDNTNSFLIGQGFVGQAALEKKPIIFNQIPDDYIKINSGLGNAVPKNIIVYPFLFENEVKGVLEIGASKEFSELDLKFLQAVSDNVAIALNASQSRERLKQLLEETQRQAEELEAQQEELKQTNEELQEKTALLEKSEAELRTQQEELQQTNEELEEKANLLEEQKRILENAKIEIEDKARELETTSKYKSEFLANMSHELRTPLNSILILSQMLMENKNNTLAEKEVQFAKNIYNSGTDLLNLINEILDLSKIESGKMELDISEFKVQRLAENMNSMFAEIARTKSINFEIVIDENINGFVLRSDKQRIEQILRNLLSNAFKFTSVGGNVQLYISKPLKNVAFSKKHLNELNVIAFYVKDNGIGIPKNKSEAIFEAFQQVDGSTKRKYGGTGLGLSISRELAHSLGGEIHLDSAEGKGSTFTLFLPVNFDPLLITQSSRKIAIREKEPVKSFNTNSRPLKIVEKNVSDDRNSITDSDRVVLIMEDDVDFANVLLNFVRERSYKGILAFQGNTGLSYARLYKPDAILLDMNLPVMDGKEVLKHLKSDPDLRHIPVQIISGYDRKKEGMELGAFDFIKKPVTHEDLWNAFDKIEDFVNRKIKRLLIVEDDATQNEAVKELIGNGDVKCFSAFSGNEALSMLTENPFDCIIVDLGLPDMTGFDFLEKIKEHKELVKIPVVVYTAKDLTREENNRLDKLANTVVLKTAFSHERLLDETMLFLHRVESRLPAEKQNMIRKLHKSDEVLKSKKVLIVDDDMRNVYSLTNALEAEGLHCITTENGREAIKVLNHDASIDIVLMDIMMPEMDGYEATREIRRMKQFKKLPVIALTAKAMKGDRDKCLAAGMSDYIAKPVNIEQLLSLMRVWLYA